MFIIAPLQPILSIQNISKSYGPVRALNGVSFDVPESSVFGILGPNGSGKTTMLGIILDVLVAAGGTYSWFGGIPHAEARRRIGSLLETPNFYHYLSGYDNLKINATIRQLKEDDRDRVLKQVGLLERKHSKFQTYSLGMKQRLAIGAALLGQPKVLVLDEPTNGLDPAGIAEIRDLIRTLHRQGITIIIASHLLDEVEKVCTHVAILKRGDLLVHGPVNEALRNEDVIEVRATDMHALEEALKQMAGISSTKISEGTLLLACEQGTGPVQVNEYCISKGIVLSHLLLKKKSLETKFMELTNN
ncbi:ABC transporter ATP-binding protein [Nemorincola caseinilytica]|uniref:ABC transporter ATP-binding protein n=1 Tax=Nemorincola caseinilytica TaxID=2054315 RepID=A0ABP8N4Q2_9BACT